MVLAGLLLPNFLYAAVPVAVVKDSPEYIKKELSGPGGLCISILGRLGTAGDIASRACSDSAAYALARLLLRALSQSLVNWIRTGGINGSPLFVENFGEHFRRELDNATGIFLEQVTSPQFMNLICSPFRVQLGNLLNTSLLRGRTYNARARCTLTDIVRNVEGFRVDFTQGGWGGWLALLEPQNNTIGSFFLAQDEAERRKQEAFLISSYETLTTGGGLLAQKVCDVRTPEGQIDRSKCRIVTPGRIVAEAAKQTFNIDVDALKLADEIDEIVAATVDKLLSSALTFGGGNRGLAGFDANAFNSADEITFRQERDQIFSQLENAFSIETQFLTLKENSLATASTTINTLKKLASCQASQASGDSSGAQTRITELEEQMPQIQQDIVSARNVIREMELRIADVSRTANRVELSLVIPGVRDVILKIHDQVPARDELASLQNTSSRAVNDLTTCQVR